MVSTEFAKRSARYVCAAAVLALPATAAAQLVVAPGPGSSPVVRLITSTSDVTVQAYGILAQTAITGPANTTSLCADIGGGGALSNTFTHSLGGGPIPAGDIRLRQRFDGTVRLPGFGGAGNDTAAVVSYLNGRNAIVSASTVTLDGTTPHNFTGGGACTQPVVP